MKSDPGKCSRAGARFEWWLLLFILNKDRPVDNQFNIFNIGHLQDTHKRNDILTVVSHAMKRIIIFILFSLWMSFFSLERRK